MIHLIPESFIETVSDCWILLPFLLATYILIEFLEHEAGEKAVSLVRHSKKMGPLIGSLLGVIPQCGFSAVASEFYAHRVITLGTLFSIYLSTSDEMLPVLIASRANAGLIFTILGIKILAGLIVGFLLDLILRNRPVHMHACKVHDEDETGSFLISALKHTVEVFIFLFLITFALNIAIGMIGDENLGNLILNRPVVGQLLASLIGLIPNCAGSVIITQLYLSGALRFGALISGLLCSAGVGPLMLLRTNKNNKENLMIIILLYAISVIFGLIIGCFPSPVL